jgi:hypothetical protein
MNYAKYIASTILILASGMIYEKYKKSVSNDEEERHYELVKKYLIQDSSLARSKLPIIWIHIGHEYNARSWQSFFSRSSEDINQPYMFLTIKSIIDKCGENFNICLIDDSSFTDILPNWNIDMTRVADPIKSKLRNLAMARLLKSYGGMILPPTFLCMKNLIDMYYTETCGGKPFVGESIDDNSTSVNVSYFPNKQIMGCAKNCGVISDYISYLENLISDDYTDESVFLGSQDRWIAQNAKQGNINIVDAALLGVSDTDGRPVVLERLMGQTYVDFSPTVLGVLLPENDILKRTSFQWFARQSVSQALACDNVAGKLLLTTR